MQRILSVLAIASCLVSALPAASLAQSLPGLTIFSGVERENQLAYRLDYGGRTNARDRYHLRIPPRKMELAAAQFAVTYPDSYRGRFDPDRIEVRVNGDSVPLEEVEWDRDNRVISIYPQDPVPASTRVEIVLSNVRNPHFAGTHYFNAQVRAPGDLPLMRYLGTWIIGIGGN